MTDLHNKRSVGERRLRRYAKAEAEKVFAHISEDDKVEAITADCSIINCSHENQDLSQDSINNINESALAMKIYSFQDKYMITIVNIFIRHVICYQ